jgi:hypothetical protein
MKKINFVIKKNKRKPSTKITMQMEYAKII